MVDRFWELRLAAEEAHEDREAAASWPSLKKDSASPVESCVRFREEVFKARAPTSCFLSRLPIEPLTYVTALCGPVYLTAMRAACREYDALFHPRNFVATWHDANVQQHKDDGFLDDDKERPDLADEDNFGQALIFVGDKSFSSLAPSALDDVFLSMRRKDNEDKAEHTERLNWFFENSFIHYDGAEEMNILVDRCQLPDCVARCIFPNAVYTTPKDSFFPRPLHVAIVAEHLELGKMLLSFAKNAECNLDIVFLRNHSAGTDFAEMSPLMIAILFASDRNLHAWLDMLTGGGARFNRLDSCVVGNVVDHDQMTDEVLSTFEARVRQALILSGAVERTKARYSDIVQRTFRFAEVRRRLRGKQAPVTDMNALELALCHFEDNGFDDHDEDPAL